MPSVAYVNGAGIQLLASSVATRSQVAANAGQKLTGTAGNDALRTIKGGTIMAGGAGDDTYYVYSLVDQVIELGGEGVDTIVASMPFYALGANVENLTLTNAGSTGWGNALDNILTATGAGQHTLDGGLGNDVLVGSDTGQERFVVAKGEGSDAIVAFQPGTDVVQLDRFADLGTFAAVKAATRQVGVDTVVNLGDGQDLTLRGVTASQLSAKDFALQFSPAGLRLTFDDEFDKLSASPLPTGKTADGRAVTWRSRYDQGDLYGRTLSSNREAEYYSDSSVGVDPFSIKDSVLTITAAPAALGTAGGQAYTSGILTTSKSFAQQYGYFEIRAQLPAGQGFWPAFWMLPTDGGWPPELDVFEVLGNDPTTLYASTHGGTAAKQAIATSTVRTADLSQGFHTYGVNWNASTVTWYLDGNQIASSATPAEMNKPMYMLVNLAVGGPGSWPGAADGATTAQMKVDYVRAYATADTVGVSGSAARPQPVPLELLGWGGSVVRGDGLYAVTGSGSGGRVVLGAGDQSVALGGSGNTVQLGAGSHRVVLAGTANTVTVGRGASSIDAGGSYAMVTVGASLSGVTTVRAGGTGAVVTATGSGSVSVSGATGAARVALGDGDHRVVLGGGGNVVTTGRGSSTIQAGTAAVVRAGNGDDAITVTGWGSLLDGGGGRNLLVGGAGSDTFVLNAPGAGYDRVGGFGLANKDVLDLSRTLAGTGAGAGAAGLARDLSDIGRFVTARQDADGTTLLADVTGGHASPAAFATLLGVQASVAQLVSAHALAVDGRIA